jgi:hypothetical protein
MGASGCQTSAAQTVPTVVQQQVVMRALRN